MQINKTDNYSFGKITADKSVRKAITNMLGAEEASFVKRFEEGWNACKNTEFADLLITKGREVYVVGKESKNMKKMKSFNSFIHNIYNGIQHVIFAEENKFRY